MHTSERCREPGNVPEERRSGVPPGPQSVAGGHPKQERNRNGSSPKTAHEGGINLTATLSIV
eukprot:4082498-Pyramimonas_sp.AAC.1